mmetsp:Transcript_4455/g.10684  ORF Transcript_4455/g.10684 Transcript_4455/m.10684 type:complete len:211 (+) Transcript_4455:2339-2971(+)
MQESPLGSEQFRRGGGTQAVLLHPRCLGDEGHVLHGPGAAFFARGLPPKAPGGVHAQRSAAGFGLHLRGRMLREHTERQAPELPHEDRVRAWWQCVQQQDRVDGRGSQSGEEPDPIRGAASTPAALALRGQAPGACWLHWDPHLVRALGGATAAGHRQGLPGARRGRRLPVLLPHAAAAAVPHLPAPRLAGRGPHAAAQEAAGQEDGDEG